MDIFWGVVAGIFQVAGSLGLFLFGMKLMSDGLQNSAGERMHTLVNYMTQNRFTALLTGLGVTSVIQSSSATTVFVVSFVNAGLLSLQQAIGVIMGANIGTTVTAWIVSVFGFKMDIAALAIPAIALGLPFIFMKSSTRKSIGETLIGFGLLFLGLMYLKDSVPDIKGQPAVLEFIAGMAHNGFLSNLLFVLIGTVITIILQSSSAAMAITLTMANAGWIDFPTAAALCLGENIGTTITAQLAALSQNRASKQAAMAHTMFNVFGVCWALLSFPLFIQLVDLLIPGDINLPVNMPLHISMFHTLFNSINSFIFIWFVPYYARLIERMVPAQAEAGTGDYKLSYVRAALQDTPEMNMLTARTEMGKMAQGVCRMYGQIQQVLPERKLPAGALDQVHSSENRLDQMQEELSRYISKCMQEKPSDKTSANLGHLLKIVDELESIGDNVHNMAKILERNAEKKLHFSKEQLEELAPFMAEVGGFLDFIQKKLSFHLDDQELAQAQEMESRIDQYRNNLKKAARKRMEHGSEVKLEIMFIDVVEQLEMIGDLALDVAEELRALH